MSAADELRTAAARLRGLATAATPGPWEGVVDDHGRGQVDASVWADSIGYYITEKISSGGRHKADADYIAAMGPTVGVALAGIFTAWARMGDLDPDLLHRDGGPETLALARLINTGNPT